MNKTRNILQVIVPASALDLWPAFFPNGVFIHLDVGEQLCCRTRVKISIVPFLMNERVKGASNKRGTDYSAGKHWHIIQWCRTSRRERESLGL